MRIQIASDLHLNLRPKATFEDLLEPVAPLLALLGDLSPLGHPNLNPFLQWCSERWDTVVWIPGWAELFTEWDPSQSKIIPSTRSLPKTLQKIRDMSAAYPNLHMLYRDTLVSSDGLLVLGLPFWKTALYGSAASPSEGEPPLELQKTLSKEDIQWLRYHLETHRIPTLVLSYLGPVPFLQKERLGNPSHSFQLPELELLLREPMVAWLCGHIHETGEFSRAWNRSSVLVAYNGKGRLNENLDYRRDYVVRLDPSLADRSTV